MLRQAVRGGARWCHAVHSPSVHRRAFSAVNARRLDFGGPNDKVTFYEQETPSSKNVQKVDPEAEDKEERKEVHSELSKLQEELRILEKGPFTPDGEFIQSLPEEDRKIALEALRKYEAERGPVERQPTLDDVFDEELDNMLKDEFEGLADEQENWQDSVRDRRKLVSRKTSQAQLADPTSHSYSTRFNQSLRRYAGKVTDERARQELWKSYRRCRQNVPDFLKNLTPAMMDSIWESQVTGQSTKSTRSKHLQIIAEDMKSIGRPLAIPQILSYIEALHEGGAVSEALEQWEAYQAELSQKKEDLEEYWMLGVRLFAAENNPQRAQDIALAFLANDRSRQSRVLIPVITAWGKTPGKEAEVKAWALYLQLKTFLGPDMTMEDYDRVSIGLLTAGRSDAAVAVFKDMMVTGQDPANDSTALYQAALGLAGNLQASSIDEQAVNKVSLSALTMLPRRFHNRFFYASWMKKLIGMGEVDSAAMVIELMYERGVKPDAKHLNGVMAGWLREGSASARDKAERLGWSMIQHRIDAVWKRYQPVETTPQVQVKHQAMEPSRIPKFLQREVPPASIETFSILLLHYTRRGDDDMVKYLAKCLGDAHIQPNSYFMNHLLYAELRKQDIRSLWSKFETMTTSIRPDLETFACLWDCAKLQYDRGRTAFDAGFPSARQLYSHMVQWFSQLSPRAQKITTEQFTKDLYDQIIRCFCLSKDLSGTLVALHSMHAAFGFAPDDVTARMIVLQVARLAGVPADTPKRRLRRLSSTPRSKENIGQVSQLLEMLGERKSLALKAQGLSIEQLDPHEKQQYQLQVMASLLRIVLSRTEGLDPVQVEAKLAKAAIEMGVEGIDLGSPLGVDDTKLL
ncbi:pentatricopeptide repeat protein [Penicillium brasilianum]|uniref:Pentatricopeptide repeat protein n=1 Tax=Penicillium brasilianum TaxID=104259 RepID=A0A1S9RH40_PENBI|nr:pentatricopeptide repeat protein [Penicillium brasilianum]